MVNRNAARHLLLVASILLCFFVYMGYRLRAQPEPARDAAPFADEYASQGGGAALSTRPPAVSSGADGGDGLGEWVPSIRNEERAPLSPPAAVPVPPPGGLTPQPAAAAASQSGAITGLIPVPPSGGSAVRAPSDSAPRLVPPFGSDPGSEQVAGDSFSPSLPSSGDSASLSGIPEQAASAPSSLPLPFSGDAFDDSYGEDNSGIAAADAPLMPSPPAAGAGTGSAPASSMRPPGVSGDSVRSSRPAYGMEDASPAASETTVSRPASPSSAAASSGASAPSSASRRVQPERAFRDEYYDDGEDEDGMIAGDVDPASGSESLRMYVVRPGDTLSNIAARELGSISLADNIFLLNRDVIEDPNTLTVGVKIRLPVRDGFIPDAAVAARPGAGVGAGAGAGRRPNQGIGRTHIVARGDTLSSIALEYYGASSGWRFLYEANKTIVPNPNQLSVGTELTIPPYENN